MIAIHSWTKETTYSLNFYCFYNILYRGQLQQSKELALIQSEQPKVC